MRSFKSLTLVAVGAAALAVASSASAAVQLEFAYKLNAGATTFIGPFAGDTHTVSSATTGPFTISNMTGTADGSPLFLANTAVTIDKATADATDDLRIWVTATGLTNAMGANTSYESDDAFNKLLAGWTVTEMTFFDPLNAAFGGVMEGSFSKTGPLLPSQTNGSFTALGSSSGPYSMTIEYLFHTTKGSLASGVTGANVNTNIYATASVPEPATWAMMILGLGGIGGLMRRRRALAIA
jgi:hypothetical protein